MIMILDTETTGMPRNWKARMTDVDNWPRIIQLAWKVYSREARVLSWGNYLIKPDGWEIPKEDFWITHGFSTEKSMAEGKPIKEAADIFIGDLQSCDFMVSHNMDFDYNVLGAELIRLDIRSEKKPFRICTKEQTTDLCRIPFPGRKERRGWVQQQYKWPKLEELYKFLFGKDFDNKHHAEGDVDALANCFFELVRRGHISLELAIDGGKIQPGAPGA